MLPGKENQEKRGSFQTEEFCRFLVTFAPEYRELVKAEFLESLVKKANLLASSQGKRKSFNEFRKLASGLSVYLKFWLPRRPLHSLKTLWHKSKIEKEMEQYSRFMVSELPVPDFVLSGVRRFPGKKRGFYAGGFIVTVSIPGGRDLRELNQKREEPWVLKGEDSRHVVLTQLGALLSRVHQSGVFHGDYMLKNIVYSSRSGKSPYSLVDLSSGGILKPAKRVERGGTKQDILRMCLSLARGGFSEDDALIFIKSYVENYHSARGKAALARASKLMASCFDDGGHRAAEAIALFADA
ncbi:MAG: hypothetical protein KGZ25_13780 [Planctomycetes bacterium]|nr:hypothetical protein [Planctomycetota bacterium]